MAKEYLPNSFDELYDKIDFVEFALHLGFQIDKSRSAKSIVLKRGDDNINVYYVKPNGEPWGNSARYYNLNSAKKNFDQGFLKELVINYCQLEDPQNKIWSASKIFHDYLNIPYGKRQEQFKERLENYTVNRNSNSLMQPIGVDDPKILPLQDTRFLKDWRELNISTIDNFKSQIFSYQIETTKGQKFYNTAFPLYFGGEVQGFECRNQTQHQNYKNFQGNAYGLWLSTTDFRNIEKICVAESAIDCLAHYELNQKMNNNTLYISYSGNLYDAKLNELTRIIRKAATDSKHLSLKDNLKPFEQYKTLNLVSIGDNDRKGAENHLRLVMSLVDANSEEKIIIKGLDKAQKSEVGIFYQLEIPKTLLSDANTQQLYDLVDKYNQYKQKTFIGNKKDLYFEYIRITDAQHTSKRKFIVPNNINGLRNFAKLFSEATNKELYRVNIPKNKDFNDDLKELKKKNVEQSSKIKKDPFVSKGP